MSEAGRGDTHWDPAQYERFAAPRTRPALDLLSRLDGEPAEIWDLGCGSGDITAMLARRWPDAAVHGLDSSAEMLERARSIGGIDWVEGDIASWSPSGPVDLVFSNAALQWVGSHEDLVPRLAATLAPGGTLAIQMPRNFDAPSHVLLAETARSPEWHERAGHLPRGAPVHEPAEYHRMLAHRFEDLDIWETEYLQILSGADPVVEWTRGTALRPYLHSLGDEAERFVADYAARLRSAYPPLPDGTTPFPFRRLFIVGRRRR